MPNVGTERPVEDIQAWLSELRMRDGAVFYDVERTLSEFSTEATLVGAPDTSPSVELESIVLRTGRPVLPIRGDRICTDGAYIESESLEIIRQLRDAESIFAPRIPSVGRIDVANSMFTIDWVGTGWLVDSNVVLTNRHVAELVAAPSGGRFVFRPGRNGTDLGVSINFKHEMDGAGEAAFQIEGVIWIEQDPRGPDIAFLALKDSPGSGREPIPLATEDAGPNTRVVTIGYPARAAPRTIPEQDLMERIFGRRYDVKRIAPGLFGERSPDNWATHDCTTLGGNSGSVVLSMDTGEAVALHFAGAFLIENYAVPASTIRAYLHKRPWQGRTPAARPSGGTAPDHPPEGLSPQTPPSPSPTTPCGVSCMAGGSVNLTIPLHVTISVGTPVVATGTEDRRDLAASEAVQTFADAVRTTRRRYGRLPGVVAVRRGYVFSDGRITGKPCVVIAVEGGGHAVEAEVEGTIGGWPIEVRAASPDELMEAFLGSDRLELERAGGEIAYDDDARTAPEFALDPVQVELSVLCHVGPERSWEELRGFLAGAGATLDCAMYEFNAEHVATALQDAMGKGVQVRLTLDSLLANRTETDTPLISQAETFKIWKERCGDAFSHTYVPEGAGGLVWNAYHIKVAVRDGTAVWLSSGNWKPSSQPDLSDRAEGEEGSALPGNREWHVILEERPPHRLVTCFRSHIQADARFSSAHAEPEAALTQAMVDVPIIDLEAMLLEAPVRRRRLTSRKVAGTLRVQPLLTPDRRGAKFCGPVLSLIRSAQKQLLFQIPYITCDPETAPQFLIQLISELVEASKRVSDFRLILRSDTRSSLMKSLETLQNAGLNVAKTVRQLPSTHTKGMVVDGRHTLIGSHNWSGAGVTINRDASLIFFDAEDIAGYYGEAFQIDWDVAKEPSLLDSLPVPKLRLAVGEMPPAGYVRVPLAAYIES